MTPEQFAYWLQGFAELNHEPPTAEQWKSIREHIAAVFKKVTPPVVQPPSVFDKQRDFAEEIRRAFERDQQEKKQTDWGQLPGLPKYTLIC